MKTTKLIKSMILMGLVGVSILTGCGTKDDDKIKIGITQIVEYSALDENREGFIKALEDNGYKDGENIDIDFQNAQGDIATTQTIAKNFVSQKKNLIYAISTPSAQAAYNSTKDIPIVISAVTDPVSAGLVKSLEEPNTNISGTCDYVPVSKQLELVKTLAPDAKKIGVIYNTSEVNSEVQVNELKKYAKEYGYSVVEAGVTSTNEVNTAISSLASKIDVLYAPTDQLVVSSMPIIVQKTQEKNIPVIASEKGSVELGALATCGINYYELGYESGKIAVNVLKGEDISKMPVKQGEEMEIMINEDALKNLSIKKLDDERIVYINTK
ncbi:MAG: ABC transporter substrate-binding protein [Tepidibacter sp.]|jgi:putative ABC transport system substrate-binding protein|uniref:ABC transporter substrate-binding protein n=1 Tax=Tepidibacter sp. TaxID=2529387 RepID=UPI0025DA0E0F|nr:ABC transporter substrate-binding protein [Tepidibacter sp.]MCT4508140.1 ABC transporter substrate-binding protein [Tepidibacter sp.]